MGFKKLGDSLWIYESGPNKDGEAEKKLNSLETKKYLDFLSYFERLLPPEERFSEIKDEDLIFHEVNKNFPTGHMAYFMPGFNPNRLVVSYYRATGNKWTLHLRP